MKGKIILIPFPFTDLSSSKRRPALVILERKHDIVVVFISSIMPDVLSECMIVVDKTHPEFPQTGLKRDSVFYLDKITTVSKDLIVGEMGKIGKRIKKHFNRRFTKLYRMK